MQKLDKGVGAAGSGSPCQGTMNKESSLLLGIENVTSQTERNLWFQRQEIQDEHTEEEHTEGKTEINGTNQASDASMSKQDDWEKSKASIHQGD